MSKDKNDNRESGKGYALPVVLGLSLTAITLTLLLGPKSFPVIGVASAQVLNKIDSVFRAALPTPWFRWFALWSVVGAALSVIVGFWVLPRSEKAPSNFERSTIATAELSRIVVIVLVVGVSFFDFITAPKPVSINSARRVDSARPVEQASGEGTALSDQRQVSSRAGGKSDREKPERDAFPQPAQARKDSLSLPPKPEPEAQQVRVEAQGLPARADAVAQPSRSDPPAAASQSGAETQSAQTESWKPSEPAPNAEAASPANQDLAFADPGPNDQALADELLPWEKPARDSRSSSAYGGRADPQPGRPRPAAPGGYASTSPGGNAPAPQGGQGGGYGAPPPGSRDDRQAGQRPGPCEFVRGRFYNVRGKYNPDLEATIEIMAKGRGLIRFMTRRGAVLLMDARVTACSGGLITVVGNNGRTEDGSPLDTYREDIFVAPYGRQSREDWRR